MLAFSSLLGSSWRGNRPRCAHRAPRPGLLSEHWFVPVCEYTLACAFVVWLVCGCPGCIKADLEPRLLTAEAKIGDISSTLGDVQTRVGTVEASVGDVQTDVTAIKTGGIRGGTNDNLTTWLFGVACILSIVSYPIQRILRLWFWPRKE